PSPLLGSRHPGVVEPRFLGHPPHDLLVHVPEAQLGRDGTADVLATGTHVTRYAHDSIAHGARLSETSANWTGGGHAETWRSAAAPPSRAAGPARSRRHGPRGGSVAGARGHPPPPRWEGPPPP